MTSEPLQVESALFFVVGNGPSLTTDVLDKLPEGRWIGMNAAYKYWDLTERYPHYYSCLDPVVVVQHADAICRMIRDKHIVDFFLHEAILSVAPELETEPCVTLLKDFLAREGTSVPFSALSRYKQTTGVLATRFCIEKGHQNLCLLGIDCSYVEELPEARNGEGYELTIQDNVERNPNYFFDGYQEKNEKYQVPNPSVHSGNLHLQSFVALRQDIATSGLDIRLSVGSRVSLLSQFCLFPYFDVRASLNLRRLQAVGVPLMPFELDAFLDSLDLWIDPKFQPAFTAVNDVVLHLFFSCDHRADLEDRVREAITQRPWLKRWFGQVRISFLNLSPEVDFYIKGSSLNVFGNKSGPNVFFLTMMAACRDYAHTMLFEADCVPVRPGWLDALEHAILDAPSGSWVVGTNYSGPTQAAPSNAYHINGNAIYATGNRDFQDYLEGDFLQVLMWLTEHVTANVAYDVAFAQGMSRYRDILKGTGVDLRQYARRYVLNPVIGNLGGTEELTPNKYDIVAEVAGNREIFVGHGIPFVQALETRQDDFPSFYAGDLKAICELRPHSFASVPTDAIWTNAGYGSLSGQLTGDVSDADQKLQMQFRSSVAETWGLGEFEARLRLPDGVTLERFELLASHAKGRVSVPVELRQDAQGRHYIKTDTAKLRQKKVTNLLFILHLILPKGRTKIELRGLRLLFLPDPDGALAVVVTPTSEPANEVERRWADWRKDGQLKLDRKFAFIEGRGIGKALPVLRPITSQPKAQFSGGAVILPLNGKSSLSLAVDLSGVRLPDSAHTVELTLCADIKSTLAIGCEGDTTEVSLSPNLPITLRLNPDANIKEVSLSLSQSGGGKGKLTLQNMRFPGTSVTPQFDRIISINPDAESFFGHFLNYEVRLGRALTAAGVEHVIAGPVDAEPKVYESHPEMAKVFSVRTNKLYAVAPGNALPDIAAFRTELSTYLAGIEGNTLCFMYCGSPEIAEVLHEMAQTYSNCTFAISLYYLSWMNLNEPATIAHWKPRLQAIAAHPRIRLIVPSMELKQALISHYDIVAEELPHPSTTFDDAEVAALRPSGEPLSQKPLTVVFPGNMRGGKGYELTSGALTTLIQETIPQDVRIRLRYPPADSLNQARRDFFDGIRDRVEITDSYLEEEEFRALLISADLVVVPYTKDRFADRTSGLLVDSLLLGKPCIVIDETWLSRTVNKYDFGLVAAEDSASMAAQIITALDQLDSLNAAALRGRDRYVADNSWQALARFLVTPPTEVPNSMSRNTPSLPTEASISKSDSKKPRRKKLLIIGNGPSARLLATAGFDLIPDDMDTFGTTAAFRFFEDIGWWPTYYALADRKVVYHHRETFARLISDPKINTQKFFLSWKVSDSDKLELIPHSSTGSFSLKKAIELGYDEIYLIGMEGAYVEEILDSRAMTPDEIAERGFGVLNLSRAESKLRIITKTPSYNPNYFFSGYQQEGDVYSLPQANTHQANWNSVIDVMNEAGADVVNLSRISKIDAFKPGDIREVFPELPENCWEDLSDPFEDRLRMVKSHYTVEAGPAYTHNGANSWTYRAGVEPSGHIQAIFPYVGKTAGRRFVGGVQVSVDRPVTVQFSIGRHDVNTRFEGRGREFTLQPGSPTLLELAPEFTADHSRIKHQLKVIDAMGAAQVNFTLTKFYLTESVESVSQRFTPEEMSFRRGERARHEGDLSLALAIYLRLSAQWNIDVYHEQALATAGAIGFAGEADLDQLYTRLYAHAGSKGAPRAEPSAAELSAVLQTRDEIRTYFEAISQFGKSSNTSNKLIRARRIILSRATKLLIDPQERVRTLDDQEEKSIKEALKILPDSDSAKSNFQRVQSFYST